MPIIVKRSAAARFGASLVLLGATLVLASCSSSDEATSDSVNTPRPDAGRDSATDGKSEGGNGTCQPSNCPASQYPGMVACCTTTNECGVQAQGSTSCIVNLPDGGGGSGGSGGADGGF